MLITYQAMISEVVGFHKSHCSMNQRVWAILFGGGQDAFTSSLGGDCNELFPPCFSLVASNNQTKYFTIQ